MRYTRPRDCLLPFSSPHLSPVVVLLKRHRGGHEEPPLLCVTPAAASASEVSGRGMTSQLAMNQPQVSQVTLRRPGLQDLLQRWQKAQVWIHLDWRLMTVESQQEPWSLWSPEVAKWLIYLPDASMSATCTEISVFLWVRMLTLHSSLVVQAWRGAVCCLGLPGRRRDAFLFLAHSNLGGREDPRSLGA